MMYKRKWLLGITGLGLLAALALGAVWASRPKVQAAPQAPLEFSSHDLVQLATRRLTVELALPGTVQAVSQATVRSKLSAEIRHIEVREGDSVVAGQMMAEFDTAPLRALLAERTAGVASARAQLAQTERTRQANEQLVRQNFISQNAFDTADSAHQAQLGLVEAAQAQLEQTLLQLDYARVKAPIGGQIARRFVQPGEKVAFDAPLFSIVDLSQIEVQVQAPVSDVGRLKLGAGAQVEVEGVDGPPIAGRIERINPSTDPGTRTISLYVSIPNERRSLRAGMFAHVRVALQTDRPGQAIALSAVREEAGQPVVWVLSADHLRRRTVSLGRRDDRAQMVEILGGLGAEERVLATRFDNLRDGMPARVLAN
jgi:membrane fusion protein, multidrug efflux system